MKFEIKRLQENAKERENILKRLFKYRNNSAVETTTICDVIFTS